MNMTTTDYDVLIIGSGPAGTTAGIYSVRACLKTCIITGYQRGGQLYTTTDVENFPGFPNFITGPELVENMIKQAENLGVEVLFDQVEKIKKENDKEFSITCSQKTYKAKSIIIATGSQAKWLGIDSEEEFKGRGVSGCATCDGMFFRNKIVAVIGGGNTAVEEALYLSKIVQKVILIHRRDSLRAEKILQERLFKTENIECIWNSELIEIIGSESPKLVNSIRIKSTTLQSDENIIAVSAVFIAIGHSPSSAFVSDILQLSHDGYIDIGLNGYKTGTSVVGIFAAGDIHDKYYKQAVTAAGYGCMASIDCIHYLNDGVS